MKILNFVPLLIWSLSLFYVASKELEQGNTMEEKDARAFSAIYWLGCLFWFVLGIILI